MRNTTPVVNMSKTNIHYDGKKQKPRRRIKTTPLQMLDRALPYLLLVLPMQQPVGCEGGVVRMDDCLAVVEEVHIRDQPNGFFTVHDEAELV